MAYYPRRYKPRRNYFKRAYSRTRVVYRGARRRYRRRNSGGGLLNLKGSHRHMLAGAILLLVGIMMFPKFRDWVAETWVKLKLPIK